jgi:hypothetical protein
MIQHEKIKVLLDTDGQEPSYCHSQGTNTKDAHQGVQANILCENREDFCIPCGSHNFNLFLADATKCLVQHLTFLGHKINEKYFSPKPLLERRWECHTANVKSIQFQVPNFQAAPAEV